MPCSPPWFVDIEGVRRASPAEWEYRRFIKICRSNKDALDDWVEILYEYEQQGYKIRHNVLTRLWHGGWRGSYWNRS